jgi:hypothetical protein
VGAALPERWIVFCGRNDWAKAEGLVSGEELRSNDPTPAYRMNGHQGLGQERQADFRGPILRSETAKGCHKVFDLASGRGFTGF